MKKSLYGSMGELRYLAGVGTLEESFADIPKEDLVEADVSLNDKLKSAEKVFLGSVMLSVRKYMRKENPGLKFEVSSFPPMGGGGNIGSVQVVGDEWKVDLVINRRKDGGWELKKKGSMTVRGKTEYLKDKAKVSDVKSESLAMAANAYYNALAEKF